MIFNGLVVDMRLESETFVCAAVDSGGGSRETDMRMGAGGFAESPMRI